MERSTRQRSSIRTVMEEAGRPLLPAEILGAAQREVPAIGLAGEVQAVDLPGEATRYELSGRAHHHHFRCMSCNRVFNVPGCPGDMQRIAPEGFVVERHEMTLYGVCSDCHQNVQ